MLCDHSVGFIARREQKNSFNDGKKSEIISNYFRSVFRKKQNNTIYLLYHQSSRILPMIDNMYQLGFTTVSLSTGKTLTLFLTSQSSICISGIQAQPILEVFFLLNKEHKFIAFVCTKGMIFSSLSSNRAMPLCCSS